MDESVVARLHDIPGHEHRHVIVALGGEAAHDVQLRTPERDFRRADPLQGKLHLRRAVIAGKQARLHLIELLQHLLDCTWDFVHLRSSRTGG